jgi:hypothetical protein
MSQIFKPMTSSPAPPGFVLSLTPDGIDGSTGTGTPVVPDVNGNINITGLPTGSGNSSPDSNFETFNDGTSTLQIAHRYQGPATTVGATTSTILTIPSTVASIINIEAQLAGITGTPDGVGGELRGTVFRGAGAPTVIGITDAVVRATAALTAASYTVSVSGNNLIVTVTGVAGQTIEWYIIAEIVVKSFI